MIIISIFCDHEDMIELQYNSILKHVKGEYEYIILNNATTDIQVKRIEDTCKSLDIQCFKLIPFNCPCDACKASGRNGNPSVMEGEALNQMFDILNRGDSGEIIFKIDSDMFFMSDIDLSNELNNTDILYIPFHKWSPSLCTTHQCKHLSEQMWAGVFGLNTKIVNAGFDCKPGAGYDTFGESKVLLSNSTNRRKKLNGFNLQRCDDVKLEVSCNNDCNIRFNNKGEMIYIDTDNDIDSTNSINRRDHYLTMYNLSHINIYEKYQSIMKYLDRYEFPDPYNIDIITVNDIDTIIHFKSASWDGGGTPAYMNNKKQALRRLLDDTISKPSVQPLKIDLNYLHSNREMVSIEHKTS